jgi:hypothetical protein
MNRRQVLAALAAIYLAPCASLVHAQPRAAKKAEKTAPPTNSSVGAYVSFPSAGVRIRQPTGFDKADSFQGFSQAATNSSIMAVSLPGPFAQIAAGFTKERMSERGMKLLGKEEVTIGGQNGVLVHFEQLAAGVTFEKWAVILGDEKKTMLVTATFPKAEAKTLSAPLKAAVLSTEGIAASDSADGLPFTITPSGKLARPTEQTTGSLVFTRDGVFPSRNPRDPLFILAPSFGKSLILDRRQTAEGRIAKLEQISRPIIKSTTAITIDGVEGFESLVDAEDKQSAVPMVVYQVMLFLDESYVLMVGFVGKDLADDFLPDFKKMARSLKMRK